MPWRPIQTGTAGLLHLLGIKNVGRNPDVLLDEVRPTLEMDGWWLRGTREPVVLASQVVATGVLQIATLVTVPQNEWWYMHQAQAAASWVQATYAATMGLSLFVTDDNGSAIDIHAGLNSNALPPFQIALVYENYSSLKGLWVPPGSRLQYSFLGAVGDTLNLATWYATRCRI